MSLPLEKYKLSVNQLCGCISILGIIGISNDWTNFFQDVIDFMGK